MTRPIARVVRCGYLICRSVNTLGVLLTVLLAFASQFALAQTVTATLPVGATPTAIAANPVTNRIYVANSGSANVTVIDGATNATNTVAVGTGPTAIAVNPVTNKIYVVNQNGNSVTKIDGATNGTTNIDVGTNPFAIAVNPVTNKIYVANNVSNNVSVIDGATNATTTVTVGDYPCAIVVNPITNKIYVMNQNSDDVTVINGANNATATVAVGNGPFSITVNPVTDKIYVANNFSNDVTIIDGANNILATIPAGIGPTTISVNPATNKIYVASTGDNKVTVIDGTTSASNTVSIGTAPGAIIINPVTNKIFVSSINGNNVTVIDGATNSATLVQAGTGAYTLAANPATNKVYVVNFFSNDVTVIDGDTNGTVSVSVGAFPGGASPVGLAVNPITNKIYVSTEGDQITVIDGVTHATNATGPIMPLAQPFNIVVNSATNNVYVTNGGTGVFALYGATNVVGAVASGTEATAVAINSFTNSVYVANRGGNSLSVIGGANNARSAVAVGAVPTAVAVDPVANRIYVANANDNSVTVIDGFTQATTTVMTGAKPTAIAVNSVTNKIYVANYDGNTVTVIDGATGSATAVMVGTKPWNIVVNSITNKVYVMNRDSNDVTLIEGGTGTTTTIAAGQQPFACAINPVTNKIYVANVVSNNVTVIDGATNTTTTVVVGTTPRAIAVNPVTNRVYVANFASRNVTVIDAAHSSFTHHQTTASVAGGAVTSLTTAVLSLSVSDSYAPYDPLIRTVYYRQNDVRGAYTAAAGTGPFSATLSGLQPGLNYVSLFAVDAMEGTSANQGANLMIGAPKVFALSAVGLPVFAETSPLNSAVVGVAYGQPIAVSGGVGILSFTVTAGALPPGLLLSTTGYLSGTPTYPGTSSFTVTVIDASGNTASRVLSMNVAGLTLLSVRSRKVHGAAGAYELTIDKEQAATGAVTVEPRVIGNGHVLVFGFNSAISSAGTVTAKNGSGTPLQSVVTLPYVNSLVVTLPAVSDNSRATISLSGVNGSGFQAEVSLGFLLGDVNGSHLIDSVDVAAVKSRSGQIVNATNFMFDLDASGAVTASDIATVKVRSGMELAYAGLFSPDILSIEGFPIPVPSKIAQVDTPLHPGMNGAGNTINAWAVNPARCNNTQPAITRSWHHNIDFADHGNRRQIDLFDMAPNEALTYKFVATTAGAGAIFVGESVHVPQVATFVSLSKIPCDFDITKLVPGPNRDFCYVSAIGSHELAYQVTNGTVSFSQCKLDPGQVYYLNLRFQNGNTLGTNTADACGLLGNPRCGGVVQIRR